MGGNVILFGLKLNIVQVQLVCNYSPSVQSIHVCQNSLKILSTLTVNGNLLSNISLPLSMGMISYSSVYLLPQSVAIPTQYCIYVDSLILKETQLYASVFIIREKIQIGYISVHWHLSRNGDISKHVDLSKEFSLNKSARYKREKANNLVSF